MSTRWCTAAWACVLAVASAAVLASQAPQGPPKPGPEHKQLQYFVGKWTNESEMKASPLGPAGKMTGKDNCEAFAGGFHVVCRSESTGPMGSMKGLGLLGYSAEDKAYTYMGIDSMGTNDVAKGTMTGADTWVYNSEAKMGGKVMKSRYTIKKIDADSYSFSWDMADESGAWKNVMEGKSTRAKGGTS